MLNSIKKIGPFITFGMFCLLFQPPIFSFNVMHLIGVLSIIILAIKNINTNDLLFVKRTFFSFLFLFIYLFIFVFALNNESFSSALFPVFYLIDVLPFSVVIVKKYQRNKTLTYFNLFEIIIFCGLIQAACSITAFLIPAVQEFFIDRLVAYGYSTNFSRFSSYRLFGFSTGLTFIMPVIQSVIAVLSIFCSNIKHKRRYILYSLFLLLSAIINARVSIVVFGIGIIFFILFAKTKISKKLFTCAFLAILGLTFVFVVLPFVEKVSPSTYQWFISGTEEIQSFASRDISGGYFAYVFNPDRYVLPNGSKGLLFGTGHNIMGGYELYGVYSDIGFINDIWLGGIIYVLFLYLFITFMALKLFKYSKEPLIKFFSLFMIGCYIVLNFKGIIFSMNGLTNLLVIVYLLNCAQYKSFKKKRA